jgi:protein TonB
MKFLLSLILVTTISAFSFSQKTDSTASVSKSVAPIYRVVQVMPEFPGGKDSLSAFIAANQKYPRSAKENRIEGTVVTEFVVETDGSLSDIKVKKSLDPKLDAEAIRLIKSMPPFKAGKQQGKAVRVSYTLPVVFKITDK